MFDLKGVINFFVVSYVMGKPKSADFNRIQGGVFFTQGVLIENTNVIYTQAPLTEERCNYNAMIE